MRPTPIVAGALRRVRQTAMGHAQQGAAVAVDKIDLDQARSRRYLFISLPTKAIGETVDRHDLAERSARRTSALATNALEEIKPARMRLARRLSAHPAQDLFRICQEGEHGGGRGGDLGLTPDHERFSHRCLLGRATGMAVLNPVVRDSS